MTTAGLPVERVRVAVVGGGPSGLTAAAALARRVDGEVRVIEREDAAGGIPRHSAHPGYGVRDLHRFVSGPAYARRLVAAAGDSGATVHTQAQVTGWDGDRRLVVTSPRGRHVVEADAVVLATGARERPRAARWIPGDRPEGVYTTGELQNLVHLHHAPAGRRAVVVGAELVSWSAVLTLREAGCRTVAMTCGRDRPEAHLAVTWAGRLALRPRLLTRTRVVRISGRDRVESVLVEDVDTGTRTLVPCDTVVLTGDWVPDHELARSGGVGLDRATLGPAVDSSLRTSATGVYAVGNLLHPVDTADGAALDGRHVAAGVLAHLAGVGAPPVTVELVAAAPFRWVTPQRLLLGIEPPRGHLLLWPEAYQRLPVVRAVQDGRVLARHRLSWPAAPGRVFRVPAGLVASANPHGGPVELGLERDAR
ncbi:NAD(P)/FAD-dependent oxidoreductase [Nocardioides cynanchi]|uniref:NAD(P)/FAD-dependent oxidoreductase n=1 Tax=Nocardioides cynanchi TaxID=2558918 RepID=UPI00192D52C3|nr:FAD-dependent oxidoreductase [Nocardioides cynanchi]